MKLQTKYVLFVVILHLLALTLTYFIFQGNPLLFLLSEIIIIFSLVISWQLYRELIQPIKMLVQGIDAIKDKDFNVKFLQTGKYEMDELINVYNRMIDELRSERARQEEQHLFLEKLINTSPTGIMILDFDGKIKQVNPKGLDLLALDSKSLLGRELTEIDNPVIRKIEVIEAGTSGTVSLSGGVVFKVQKSHFIDRGFARQFVMIEELTAEILAAEKKTYGKVIRIMAHEVNNTIGPVNSILQSTVASQNNSERIDHALRVAIRRNDNLNAFMRNFADLVRVPPPQKAPIDLVQLSQNVIDLMRLRSEEKKIFFELHADSPAFVVPADSQQMEQVMVNVIKNAYESIKQEGKITVLVKSRSRCIVVQDSGGGIAPEFESQLFSPFFSTKRDGQGIGLALIREILQNHGFEFSLKTLQPGLTEFRIQIC
ncbi:MAG TPA: ATP-binding protein [Puia sp.]|nr:ATP-binding protein [Puia sp.]